MATQFGDKVLSEKMCGNIVEDETQTYRGWWSHTEGVGGNFTSYFK